MKIIYGEYTGGMVSGMLLVEVKGVEYPKSRHNGPLLPAFKTAELSWETLTEIFRYLPANECSLTNGPVFNDYNSTLDSPTAVASSAPEEPDTEKENAEQAAESGVRSWMLADSSSLEAELLTTLMGHAVLKNKQGRQIKIPMKRFSEADRSYIRLSSPPDLDISFSKSAKKREFGDTYRGGDPAVRSYFYTFTTRIKQTSVQPYGLGLKAESFIIGKEIGANKRILLDYQKAEFSLTKENEYTFELASKPVELMEYGLNGEHRGQSYHGQLVVIKDSRGKIIAHKASSKTLLENLDSLRKIKVGWYFDDDCNRCLPTPPTPWATSWMSQ